MRITPVLLKATATLGVATAAIVGANVSSNPVALAQACQALSVVDGAGTEVTKTVSPPGVLFIDSNWNTDFSVPSGVSYRYFEVTFTPESGESYDVDVNLKYSDDSIDQAYSVRDRVFTENEAVSIQAESRASSTPYQINLRVGGLNASGNTYTASVRGCR